MRLKIILIVKMFLFILKKKSLKIKIHVCMPENEAENKHEKSPIKKAALRAAYNNI